MRRALLLGLLAGVALALGCSSVAYTPVTPPTFANAAPRFVTFDALVRRAGALGYEFVAIDPQTSSFAVHSRVMGRPGRRGRRARMPAQSLSAVRRSRTDVFVVSVGDTAVQVFALGPHVRGETMHPSLAQELGIFAEGMQRGVPMPMGAPMAGPPMMAPAPAPSAPAPAPAAPAPAAPSETLTAP